MEAHPPYLLPKGRCPSGLPLGARGTPLDSRRDRSHHPPSPLPSRKGGRKRRKKVYGGTSSIPPAKGGNPLWTPPVDTRSRCHCEPQRSNLGRCGAPGEGAVGRHILYASCQRGGAPLDSPCRHPLALSLRAAAKQSGEVRGTWGGGGREAHPPYLLPKGLRPSGLLLSTPARAVIASRSEAIWGGAGHLGRGRSGGAPHNES